MKVYSLFFTAFGSLLLAGIGFFLGLSSLGAGGLVLLAGWIATTKFLNGERIASLLLALSTAFAVTAIFRGGNTYAVLGALTLILIGWEIFHSSLAIAAFIKEEQQSFAKQYMWPMLALGAAGMLLAMLSLQVQVRLTFRLGLALGLAAIILLGLILRSSGGRTQKHRRR